jgi:hypothetical protein
VTQANILYDLNSDGVVNSTDLNIITQNTGTQFATTTDSSLAAFKPATASSINNAGEAAASAFDNNLNTRWDTPEGSPAQDPSWIIVNLDKPANIHEIQINWNSSAANYSLWTSNSPASLTTIPSDPSTAGWTPIQTSTPTTNTQVGVINTFTGLKANGQYVLMLGTSRVQPSFGYSINEFQVVGSFTSGTVSQPQPPTGLTATPGSGR